jgi:ribose 5-phosphate isomerase B
MFEKSAQIKEVFIASDHAGFDAKQQLLLYLKKESIQVTDLGCYTTESVDYPIYGALVANHIKRDDQFGILICGSGVGISIAANRFSHIRAALCHTVEYAKLARQHNDANVLALGARMLSVEEMQKIAQVFLSTAFEGDRHSRRVKQLGEL